MKLNKFTNVGLIAAVVAITTMSQPALAGSSSHEDYIQPQGACMVQVNDSTRTRVINVEYIRLVQVENKEPTKLHISMASNYYNGSTDQIMIVYPTNADAVKGLQELTDKINDCQYNAQQKRKMKK